RERGWEPRADGASAPPKLSDIGPAATGRGVCLTSMGSEMNARRVLNFTAIISSRYAGALSHGAASDACVGIVLNERIRQIVELHSKFERNALGDRKIFDQGRV